MQEVSDLSPDTSLEAARVYLDGLRRMSPARRAQRTFELNARQRQLMETGVRRRHPEYDDRQVRLAVIRLMWGDELFQRVFPGVEVRP